MQTPNGSRSHSKRCGYGTIPAAARRCRFSRRFWICSSSSDMDANPLPRSLGVGGIAYPRRVKGLKDGRAGRLSASVCGSTLGRAGAPLTFTIVVTAVPVAVVAVVTRPAGLVALILVRTEIRRAALPAAPVPVAVADDVPDLAPRAVAVDGRATAVALATHRAAADCAVGFGAASGFLSRSAGGRAPGSAP